MELQKQTTTVTPWKSLSNTEPDEIIKILKLSNVWQTGLPKGDEFFSTMAALILDRFPDLPINILAEAIKKGIAGDYAGGTYTGLNSFTIFSWIKQRYADLQQDSIKKTYTQEEYNNLWAPKQ